MRSIGMALVSSFFLFLSPARALEPKPISSPASIDKVLEFLQQYPQVRTIDRLLSYLPEDFRSNYTLMHASHSLQAATPESPRAIVYGTDARFIVAFNGSPAQSRYRSLETVQFRDDSASFEFREIELSPDKVTVSAINPPLCLSCHQLNPRPNWEHYNVWPGAFASKDDLLKQSDPQVSARIRAFLERAATLDRYRQLIGVREGYHQDALSRTDVLHNITFLHRVSQLNFKRIARAVRQLPDYDRFKFLMLGTVWCADLTAFFPTEGSPVVAAVREALRDYQGGGLDGTALAVFGKARGIDTRSWYLDFLAGPEHLSMSTPFNISQVTTMPMLADSELKSYFRLIPDSFLGETGFRPKPIGSEAVLCSELAEKSRTALAGGER